MHGIKSGKAKWRGAWHIYKKREIPRVLVAKRRKRPLGKPKCDGTIILDWILERRDGRALAGFV
jgi:hypothetical protein